MLLSVAANGQNLLIEDFTDTTTLNVLPSASFANATGAFFFNDAGSTLNVAFGDTLSSFFAWDFNDNLLDLSTAVSVELTATALLSGNGSSSYQVAFQDSTTATIASATFAASSLTGSEVSEALVFGGGFNQGDLANVERITVFASQLPAQNWNITFDNLSVTQVPEPSTYALMLLSGLGLYLIRRIRK